VAVFVNEMKRSGRYYLSQTVKIHSRLPRFVRPSFKQERRLLTISADACVGGLIHAHWFRAAVRVGTIQLGVADLPSPGSIQPDSRVTIIGALSESFSV
jgi:hypothetical protein